MEQGKKIAVVRLLMNKFNVTYNSIIARLPVVIKESASRLSRVCVKSLMESFI